MGDNIVFLIPILGVCVALVAVIGEKVIRPYIRLKEREMELQAQMTAEKAAQYASHVERLEQRVRVLERIATDGGSDLSSEIEALRGVPPPPVN